MESKEHIASDGTPQPKHVFAVFDNQDQYNEAAHELARLGMQPERFEGEDAAALKEGGAQPGVGAKLSRFLKGMMGGENHMAEVYGEHIEQGHVVMSLPAENPDVAGEITRTVTKHGAYDVTYFRDWTIQYMSPSENIDRGLPTRSMTNTESPQAPLREATWSRGASGRQ